MKLIDSRRAPAGPLSTCWGRGKGSEVISGIAAISACVGLYGNVPPPPANQIIRVILKKPTEGLKTMDTFWVSGTLSLQHGDSSLGIYGYRMNADRIDPYGLPKGVK